MFDFVESNYFYIFNRVFSIVYLGCMFFYLYRLMFKNMLGYQYNFAKFLFKLVIVDLIISTLKLDPWACLLVFVNGLIYLFWIEQEKKHFKIKEHSKKELEMIIEKELKELLSMSENNPGAFNAIVTIFGRAHQKLSDVDKAIIYKKLKSCKSIRGTNLYVLWNDLCNNEVEKVLQLCQNCPDETLEDACSRQDYSGKELVEQYFQESNSE